MLDDFVNAWFMDIHTACALDVWALPEKSESSPVALFPRVALIQSKGVKFICRMLNVHVCEAWA
jgi:hypothetical protein